VYALADSVITTYLGALNTILMHATRFNGFAMIHKALRAMLYDAAHTMQQTDYADPVAMETALEKVERVILFFDEHADHEDAHVLPLIADTAPALSHSFEEEHIADRQLGLNLNNAIASYRASGNDIDRLRAGHGIFYAFNAFIAFNLNHMDKEETELNEVMWRQLSDEEIMGINAKISASIAPERSAETWKWMMRACNNRELTGFIRVLQTKAPPPVLEMALGIARQELGAERFELVRQAASAEVGV
jgi:hemerythrin-like domain-containing protein